MAWIYLAESEDSQLDSANGSHPLLTVKTTDMPKLFYFQGCPKKPYRLRRSGTISELWVPITSDMSTSFTEDSHAKTSVLQELERAWMETEADWLKKSLGSLAQFDQDSFYWKTSQLFFFEDIAPLSVTWPRWGMIVDGQFYQPEKLEPFICEKDGGYLPTPTAKNYGHNQSQSDGARKRYSLHRIAMKGELPGHPQGPLNPAWIEQAMGYPTEYTDIEPWATQWFQSRQKRHLKDCVV